MFPRILHTMIRVQDFDKSIDFYTNVLGMNLYRKQDYPTGRFSLAFVGFAPEEEQAVLELTYNWDQTEPYDLGSGFGHLAITVEDMTALCDKVRAAGYNVPRPPGPMAHGTSWIAFIEDPDGYKIELCDRS